ncbi:hypothetical protein [Lysobacter panacisoli]|uniref:Phosphatidate cytidylyltransferase n=1 Tax=Lysobacter panacisoli TaxID=1255263 RepID=A0ABP9LCD4_9GAMM|nr:hypothetical protein [Lysobacter panacisoli]
MDKTKAKVIALIAVCGAALVALGVWTADSWAGLIGVMFGAM